ncbi:alpha/beta hydrolase [Streptomyces sp. HNM0574]|uniref:alpha/beta fold hydrolase n=1 Tax=Streptomyces sp. HNM0574 TaxID=2714954 RepID=UPI00146CBC5A|nr:alpha/beta hydrolase [Streptomyces sp. HNM0574]NLU70016.1 alpha/beta hydrolase [Streptomyces sp. HNM0574]
MARLTQSLAGTRRGIPLPVPTRELSAVSADGVRIHTEVFGDESDPAIVLAHGWTCSIAFWAPVIRELTAAGYRVVAYDQRGHGRTPAATPQAYSPATLADDLCAVLGTALAAGERAVVGGHSMGGMTLMAAAGRPELEQHAAAYLLCSTGARRLLSEARVLPFRTPGARARAHKLVLGSSAPLGPVSPLTKKALKYATMGAGSAPAQVDFTARIVHSCPTGVRAAWGKVLAHLDLGAKVGALTAPAAVVIGTEDRLTPQVHARELAEQLPDCAGLHTLTGLGHMAPVEAPEAVASVLKGLARDHLTADAGSVPKPEKRGSRKRKTGTQQKEDS